MIKCLECGHNANKHADGSGPFWPCLVSDCDCYDVIYKPQAGLRVFARGYTAGGRC